MIGKIFITDRVVNPTIELKELGEYLTNNPEDNVQVLMVWHQEVTGEYLDKFSQLHTIIRYGVGYDKIDLEACRKRNITVCNNPDYCTEEVSDTAIAFILNCSREITRYDFKSKSYSIGWQENVKKNIKRSKDTTVGFIGLGRIGATTLKKINYLGYDTCFYDPYVSPGSAKVFNTRRFDNINDLLQNSDIVSLHCPLDSNTQGMINDAFISNMKEGSSLVNTARGSLIKDLSLIEKALREERLNMVCLDVLPEEPPNLNDSLIKAWIDGEDWIGGRLVINPHSSYHSIQSSVEQRIKASRSALLALLEKKHKYLVFDPK